MKLAVKSSRRLSPFTFPLDQKFNHRKSSISKSPDSYNLANNQHIKSQRTIRPNHLRRLTTKHKKKETLVHASNDVLFAELELYSISGLTRFEGEEGQQRKDLVVISKIQEFYQQYNSFCAHNFARCHAVTWIVLSNAVNGQQIEAEFNFSYQPIKFYFLKDMQEVVNFMNFKQKIFNKGTKDLNFFSKIVNFCEYQSSYKCISNSYSLIQSYSSQQNNQLWIASKQHLSKLCRQGLTYYFLGENSSKQGLVQLVEVEGANVVYVLVVADFETYLNSVGIKQYVESLFDNAQKTDNPKVDQTDARSSCLPTNVTDFAAEFKQFSLQKSKAYSQISIGQFSLFLNGFRQDSSQLVVMSMEDYVQQRQRQLKETEVLKNAVIELYLRYGNEFILRNKSGKYTFLKREQLCTRIKAIILQASIPSQENEGLQQLFERNFHSDIQHNRQIVNQDTYSTPNLYYFSNLKANIIICVPKWVPFHTFLDRSQQRYSLLAYTHIKQAAQLSKHIPNDYFASIITTDKTALINPTNRYEYVGVTKLTQKSIRDEIDKIITRFQLGSKQGAIAKKRKPQPALILYSNSNQKQIKIVNRMKELFENTKIMTMAKKEFKAIKKMYKISDQIQLYQIGKPQIAYAKRLKTPLEMFNIFMSPHIGAYQYSGQGLVFSTKQLLLRNILDKSKKRKGIKTSQQLALSRSLSPKSKSILQKECFTAEPGLVILQSNSVDRLLKKQKFTNIAEFLTLCIYHHSKGSQIIVVISQCQFFELKQEVNVYAPEIVWMVMVDQPSKCIIRQSNIVFCKNEQFQHVLSRINEAYRNFKEKKFSLQGNKLQQQSHRQGFNAPNITIETRNVEKEFLSSLQSSIQNPNNSLCLYYGQRIKSIRMQQLQSGFIFNKKSNFDHVIKRISDSNIALGQETEPTIEIVCSSRNKIFVQESLRQIEDSNYILIIYEHKSELSSYSTPSMPLFVLEKEKCSIKHQNSMFVQSSQTPQTFSRRLKIFLGALRKNS